MVCADGLIPAHAGKTHAGRPPGPSPGAHPRSRGENTARSRPAKRYSGSSPLTRGKPAPGPALGQYPGLIPAHAGKTFSACRRANSRWAHPRSRGENGSLITRRGLIEGSSPLTRGKPLRAQALHGATGLIPAHAGKTRAQGLSGAEQWAHPRSRGENVSLRVLRAERGGSSPLTRGKLQVRHCYFSSSGLIPAHAGKTSLPDAETCSLKAHPRSRGENISSWSMGGRTTGSSPLTRGKQGDRSGL